MSKQADTRAEHTARCVLHLRSFDFKMGLENLRKDEELKSPERRKVGLIPSIYIYELGY